MGNHSLKYVGPPEMAITGVGELVPGEKVELTDEQVYALNPAWFEGAAAIQEKLQVSEYDGLTRAELDAKAVEAGLNPDDYATKDDVIAALEGSNEPG